MSSDSNRASQSRVGFVLIEPVAIADGDVAERLDAKLYEDSDNEDCALSGGHPLRTTRLAFARAVF